MLIKIIATKCTAPHHELTYTLLHRKTSDSDYIERERKRERERENYKTELYTLEYLNIIKLLLSINI